MKFLKIAVRKFLTMVDPDLEYRLVDQFHFNQMKRKSPELMWQALAPGPEARLDAGSAQVGHELFVFGGFRYDSTVVKFVDVFDMQKEQWTSRVAMPEDVPQTHLGVCSDGQRYIYIVCGQLGNYCLPAIPDCFVFDVKDRSWGKLPPLPKTRYAPSVQLWQGRLHAIAGAQEDRNTPAVEHWSIGVKDGKALEQNWRAEPPIPRGGHHRASAIVNDHLYMFGGQEGDWIAIPGDPDCRCTPELTTEIRHPEVYRLKQGARQWERMADMPVITSHTESSVVKIGERVVISGGDRDRVAMKDEIILNDEIQVYDTKTDSWKIAGRLPYRLKEAVGGYYNGSLFLTSGQRDNGPDDSTPMRRFERGMWKAKFEI